MDNSIVFEQLLWSQMKKCYPYPLKKSILRQIVDQNCFHSKAFFYTSFIPKYFYIKNTKQCMKFYEKKTECNVAKKYN